MAKQAYFITKKWNFDPTSTRRARQAAAHIGHAKDRLMATGADYRYGCPWMDLTPETEAAIAILNAAGKRIAEADEANQCAAKQGEV